MTEQTTPPPADTDAVLRTAEPLCAGLADIADRLLKVREHHQAIDLLNEALLLMGIEQGALFSFVREGEQTSACDLLMACDPVWVQLYLQNRCMPSDPWITYAASHSQPTLASSVEPATLQGLEVTRLAERHGLASVMLVPAHSGATHSRIGLLVLGSSQAGRFESQDYRLHLQSARMLAGSLHEWWIASLKRELVLRSRVSDEDLDLLRWHLQGLTSKQIAAKLGVPHTTVNSHFGRVMARLGVDRRRRAALLADECGLLRR